MLTISVFVDPAVGSRSPQRSVWLYGLPGCGFLCRGSLWCRSGGRTVARGQRSREPQRNPGARRGQGVLWEGKVLLRELLYCRKTAEGVRDVLCVKRFLLLCQLSQ